MKEHLLRAHFNLPSVVAEDPDGKPPIYVRFEIPYYTVSGLQVLINLPYSWALKSLTTQCPGLQVLINYRACLGYSKALFYSTIDDADGLTEKIPLSVNWGTVSAILAGERTSWLCEYRLLVASVCDVTYKSPPEIAGGN